MKHKKVKILSVILCLCLLGGFLYQSGALSALGTALNIATSEPAEVVYKTNPKGQLGTEENPFMVLEIVPTLDQAQFGYFIPGCEPVDMTKIEANYNQLQQVIGQITDAYSTEEEDIYSLYEDIPASTPYYVFPGTSSTLAQESYSGRKDLEERYIIQGVSTQYGTWYQKTDDLKCKANGYFQKVEEGTGNYRTEVVGWYPFQTANVEGIQYAFVYDESGDYVWHTSDEAAGESSLEDKVWMERNDLFRCHVVHMIHNDTFIQKSLNVKSSSFQSEVVTMTPELLKDNMQLIDEADFIIIRSAQNTSATSQLWNFASKYGNGILENGEMGKYKDHDLTNAETIAIMRRMGSENPAALVMEATVMRAAGAETNVSKLTYMALQFKPEQFCERFLDQVENDSKGHDKLYYSGANDENRKYYWDLDTFRYEKQPDGSWKDIRDEMRFYSAVSTDFNIMDKIMTYNGDVFDVHHMLSGDNIAKPDGEYTRYTQEWIEYYGEDPANPGQHSLLDAIEYILSQPAYTPKLRILEVQGCDEYIYGSAGWKEYYQSLFPWYHPKTSEANWLDDENLIEVTTMPTWEFIGSTGRYDYGETDDYGNSICLTTESSDDLTAKYDLIIFGSKQDASNGKNGYNKYSYGVDLGNLVYATIGGTLTDSPGKLIDKIGLSTRLDMRYAGNDITLKKLLELEDFLRAGKPIVADEGLYAGLAVDTAKVDKNSKLYDLLTYSGTGRENLFVHNHIDSARMKSLLSGNICRIEFYDEGYPIEYTYSEVNKSFNGGTAKGVIQHEVYLSKESDGTAILEYHFYISGSAADSYNVYLNLDLDGDGVYSGSLKQLSEVYNMNDAEPDSVHTVDTSEPALGMKIYDAGHNLLGTTDPKNPAESYALQANTEYYATRVIPSYQQGIIPWKLEVQSRSNSYLRSSAIDYTAVYNSQKEGILVLQMNLTKDMMSDKTGTSFTKDRIVVKSGETYSQFDTRRIVNNGVPETTATMDNTTARKFRTYLDPVNEFDVTIQFMHNSDWRKLFDTSEPYATKLANWEAFLSHYDMLVFGFIDSCQFTENQVFAEGLKDYIAQGKSVIFSHDTVYGSDALLTGYPQLYGNYTSWLRTTAGQRRSFYNKQNDGSYVKSYTDVESNGTWVSFASASNLNNNNYKKAFKELTEAVDGETVYSRFWGTYVNDWTDNSHFLYLNTVKSYGNQYKTDRVTKDGAVNKSGWTGSAVTNYVKLTNNGQITTYPYKINDIIEILTSHTQYYQLDLEYLDEGDVNVWFNLGDAKDDEVQAYLNSNGKSSSSAVNLYSARDQDCRNSFFIYNKGNITYTGSGHVSGSTMPDDEVKLFVNTMIAAYRQSESKPYAKVDNADTVAADGSSVLYLDYDGYEYENPDGTASGIEKGGLDSRVKVIDGRVMVGIELSIHDMGSSELTDKRCRMCLYQEDGTTPIDEANVIIKRVKEDDAGNVTEEDVALAGKDTLKPYYPVDADDVGVKYMMYVPYSDITEGDGISSYTIGVYATYTKSKRFVTTATTKTDMVVMLLPLFDLN